MSSELLQYILRIAPGVVAFALFLFLIPKQLKFLRIFAFVLFFVLVRDAMTPVGLWSITKSLEIRFIGQPLTLFCLAMSSLGIVALTDGLIDRIWHRGLWLKKSLLWSVVMGLIAGLVIAALPIVFRYFVEPSQSPKPEGNLLIFAILSLAFFGNLLEEVIFRGHLQNYLVELGLPKWRVIVLSGAVFAVCHSYLAFTVTDVGWPILVFTFYEGVLCAVLRDRLGLLAAALAHGMGIFILATGI
jgi:uncharacterized protein